MFYPGFEPGALGSAAAFPNHFAAGRRKLLGYYHYIVFPEFKRKVLEIFEENLRQEKHLNIHELF